MSAKPSQAPDGSSAPRPLSLDEYKRYGRQMIMPDWGLTGQLLVKAAKVAVVGAGGLGCPLLQYLAGAGVGTIGIFDHDTVDVSNLHRQVLHGGKVGMNKAVSASEWMAELNPHINVIAVQESITPSNALDSLGPFDIIVDCTDRPYTRYLLSDASVLLDKPLVSGAAISSAGQWAVYGGKTKDRVRRACYRCMWPRVVGDGGGRCDETGVWGPVVGLVGVAMAGEVLGLIIKRDSTPALHLYHMGASPLVRTVKMRPPSPKCIACGPEASLKSLQEFDYDSFCSGDRVGGTAAPGVQRISAVDFAKHTDKSRLVVDTRPPVEYAICALPGSTNIPLDKILCAPDQIPTANSVVFVCRRGNDSLIAANALRSSMDARRVGGEVGDVIGGLVAWSRDVDPEFPLY